MRQKKTSSSLSFFQQIQRAQKQFKKLENDLNPKTEPSFNLIKELHIKDKDVYENAHTRILAGVFEYDTRFFRSFLQRCGSYNRYVADNINVKVERQYDWDDSSKKWISPEDKEKLGFVPQKGGGRCRSDCLVWNQNQFAIIIENKINGASETEHQIDNYLNAVSNDTAIFCQPEKANIWVIYLGGDGIEMPSRRSLKDGKPYVVVDDKDPRGRREGNKLSLVTYKDVIIPWLEEDVLPLCPYGDPGITGGLLVYIDYLKRLYYADNALFDSKDVLELFKSSTELAPFYKTYSLANRLLGKTTIDKVFNRSFLEALKHYYLNYFFRFEESWPNDIWTIRTNGHTIQVWKRKWEIINKRRLSICDLFFEMYPYQVENIITKNNERQAFTCRLVYKGCDDDMQKKIDSSLQNYGCVTTGAFVYNKASQKSGTKAFKPDLDKGFFVSFIEDNTITRICLAIEDVIN